MRSEELAVGDAATLTVSLDAGSYALICNLVEEEGELGSHYQEGLRRRLHGRTAPYRAPERSRPWAARFVLQHAAPCYNRP